MILRVSALAIEKWCLLSIGYTVGSKIGAIY